MPASPPPAGSGVGGTGAGGEGERQPFAYAPIRVVPRVERGECLNAGVILYCRSRRFLDARTELDAARLRALAPDLDLAAVGRQLDLIRLLCAGDPSAGALASLPQPERFGWLVAPASTVVQPGPVHAGLTADPAATLARLFAAMVRPPETGTSGLRGMPCS